MTKLIQTCIHDGRLTRRIDESDLAKRAEQLVRSGRMPSKEEVEQVIASVLGPKKA
jgi:hypothetical protein